MDDSSRKPADLFGELSRGLDQAHFAAIGQVAASWAYFELFIDSASWSLVGLPERQGTALTAQISGSGRKLDAYCSLAKLDGCKPALEKALNKFCDDVRRVAERRNRVIHDPWHSFGFLGEPHRIEATARGKVVVEAKPVPTTELVALDHEIKTLTTRFEALAIQVRDEHGMPPEVWP